MNNSRFRWLLMNPLLLLFFWILAIFVLTLTLWLTKVPITFKSFTYEDVLRQLSVIFLAALFAERALEVFITTWRGPGANDREKTFKQLDKHFVEYKAMTPEALQAAHIDLQVERGKLDAADREYSTYKSQTQRIALWSSLILGLAISAVGVRSIEMLVDAKVIGDLAASSPNQVSAFRVVDVLLTGGLIGGGSEGVHKVAQVFTDFMDKTRQKINA